LAPTTTCDSDRPRKVPKWVPVSVFIGTSLALAIPLFMIRRQRGAALRLSLKNTASPPPRRPSSTTANFDPKSITSGSAPVSTTEVVEAFSSEGASPGVGEMMSAMNASSAFMAAKAFGIATALVAVGGMGLMWGVKTTLGVNDAREFGQKMRYLLWMSAPSLASRIHRPPETEEERHQIHAFAPFGIEGGSFPQSTDEEWTWEKAEDRLKKAYEEGGLPLWSQAALREVEAEARIERVKREREFSAQVSKT